jgi:hypothetical protein
VAVDDRLDVADKCRTQYSGYLMRHGSLLTLWNEHLPGSLDSNGELRTSTDAQPLGMLGRRSDNGEGYVFTSYQLILK